MEKHTLRSDLDGRTNAVIRRQKLEASIGLLRGNSDPTGQTASSDFLLQWGNRKRLRCMKVQNKDEPPRRVQRSSARIDRQVVRSEKDVLNLTSNVATANKNNNRSYGYSNLRQRISSPQAPLKKSETYMRPSEIGSGGRKSMGQNKGFWNSENSSAMRRQGNGGAKGFGSPDKGSHDKRFAHHRNSMNNHTTSTNDVNNNKSEASSDRMAHDGKKGGSPSGSGEALPPVWPPKFMIALSNKEKEEDFLVLKGSKPPQRPKKRAKLIQRTLNHVCPGAWLCDLTLERYEVREKRVAKKRPRGLKAMGSMESDSE